VLPGQKSLTFPLTGKFRAVVLRVAVAPQSPAKAKMKLRVLVDGHEVDSSVAMKKGDAPRLMTVRVHNPRDVGFIVDSATPSVKALLIDPVAIREP